jgi:hypothetical protein
VKELGCPLVSAWPSHALLSFASSVRDFRLSQEVTIKVRAFWNAMQCSLVDGYQQFVGTCCFYILAPSDTILYVYSVACSLIQGFPVQQWICKLREILDRRNATLAFTDLGSLEMNSKRGEVLN